MPHYWVVGNNRGDHIEMTPESVRQPHLVAVKYDMPVNVTGPFVSHQEAQHWAEKSLACGTQELPRTGR
jgi:hypothetical protein